MTFMKVMRGISNYLDRVSDSKGGFCMWNMFFGFISYEALGRFAYNEWTLFGADMLLLTVAIAMISTHPIWKMQQ